MQCCDFDRFLTEFAGNCKHEHSFGFQAGAEHIKMLDPLAARTFVMTLSREQHGHRVVQGPCQDVCKCWAVSSYVLSAQS